MKNQKSKGKPKIISHREKHDEHDKRIDELIHDLTFVGKGTIELIEKQQDMLGAVLPELALRILELAKTQDRIVDVLEKMTGKTLCQSHIKTFRDGRTFCALCHKPL